MHLGLWNYREASVAFQIIHIQKLSSATEKGVKGGDSYRAIEIDILMTGLTWNNK